MPRVVAESRRAASDPRTLRSKLEARGSKVPMKRASRAAVRAPSDDDSTTTRWLWAVFAFFVFVAYWPGLEEPGRWPREAAMLAGVFALAVRGIVLRRVHAPPRTYLALLALPFAAGLVGVALAPGPERLAVAWDLALLAVPWLSGLLLASESPRSDGVGDAALGVIAGATAGTLVVGALGAAQYWFGFDAIVQARAPAATFVNRNVAAEALVVGVPLAGIVALCATRGIGRAAALAAIASGSVMLVAARSRAAWIACGVAWSAAVIVFLAQERRARARLVATALGIVVAAALVSAAVPAPEAQRLPSVTRAVALLLEGREDSTTIRRALWSNTLGMVEESPWIGVGPGRYAVSYASAPARVVPTPDYGLERRVEHAHNDALHLAAELGVVGAASLFALLAGAVLRLAARARRAPSARESGTDALLAAALAGLLVNGLFSFPLESPTTGFLAFAIAGIGWRRGEAMPAPTVARFASSEALVVLALLPALAALPVDFARVRALARALSAFERGDCVSALAPARDASEHAFRRGTRGLAAMIVFECERDPRRSLEALEPALAMDPHNLNLLLATGARRLKAERVEGAGDAFAHAAALEPGLARAWLGVAMVAEARGDARGVADACRRARVAPNGRIPEIDAYCRGR